MPTCLKVRSIYSTALTRLFLDAGYGVVDPSPRIRERFSLDLCCGPHDVLVRDRDDLQGIEMCGLPEHVCQVLTFLQERLLDPVLLEIKPAEEEDNLVRAGIEFPGASKQFLDDLRFSVTPTLEKHHRLRIIDSRALERAEHTLARDIVKRVPLGESLFLEKVILPLEKRGMVRMEHIRPSGRPMRPREGVLVAADSHRIVFRRSFQKGRYDGLDLPIEEGDYGLTEVEEGSWVVKHCYFTREGRLIGEYHNINTPVEFYPFGARYLDLEIDVVRRAGGPAHIIDREKLALLAGRGCIGPSLEAKAVQIAESVLENAGHPI